MQLRKKRRTEVVVEVNAIRWASVSSIVAAAAAVGGILLVAIQVGEACRLAAGVSVGACRASKLGGTVGVEVLGARCLGAVARDLDSDGDVEAVDEGNWK